MTYYAIFNEAGLPRGFFTEAVHGNNIPQEAIAITDEQWSLLTDPLDLHIWVDGDAVPYTPEPVVIVPETVSDRQFFQQLAIDGEITQAEALAAVATGTVPAALADGILLLPEAAQFAANMFLQGATIFERHHMMTLTLASLMGWDGPMLDALWTNAAAL